MSERTLLKTVCYNIYINFQTNYSFTELNKLMDDISKDISKDISEDSLNKCKRIIIQLFSN